MKKNRFFKAFFVLGAAALSLLTTSCKDLLSQDNTDDAYLTVSVAQKVRTILPEFNLEDMQFTLYGTLTDENGLKGDKRTLGTFVDYKSLQTDIISLEKGDWEFELQGDVYTEIAVPDDFDHGYISGKYYGKDAVESGKIRFVCSSFAGSCTETIKKGENAIAFELSLKSDFNDKLCTGSSWYYDDNDVDHDWISIKTVNTGTVEVTLNLPENSNVYVKANLVTIYTEPSSPDGYNGYFNCYANSTNVKDEILEVKDSAVTFKKEGVYYGYYDLSFDIYDDQEYEVKVNTYKELVRVVSGCTSKAERSISLLNSKFYDITYEFGDEADWADGFVAPENFVSNQVTKLPNAAQLVRDDGYVLEGFYDNEDYSGKTYTSITGFENDITLYANWVKGFAVTEDTVKNLNLKNAAEDVTVVAVGFMNETLKEKINESSVEVDLILSDIDTLSSLSDCSNLRSVRICEGVKTIPGSEFCNCNHLTTVYIPESVTKAGNNAFGSCPIINVYIDDLSSYLNIEPASADGYGWLPLEYSGNETDISRIYLNKQEITKLVIPSDVKTIYSWAFGRCSNITSITIPKTVKEIKSGAFHYCNGIKELNLASLENYLNYSENLTSVSGNSVTVNLNEEPLTELTIPSSVKEIKASQFANWGSVTSVTVPSSVKKIGDYAFIMCTNLKKVTLSSSVTSLGNEAFEGCTSLEEVTLSSSLTSIGFSTFYNCSNLKEIEIPDSVTTLGNQAFANCSNLTKIKLPASITSIGDYEFYNCSSLKEIEIPSSVTTIGEWAFANCLKLEKVEIPSSVTTIKNNAFSDCESLTSLEIPSSVTTIEEWAFSGCESLTSLEIPSSVTSIGNGAFAFCSNLIVKYPASANVGTDAFQCCEEAISY